MTISLTYPEGCALLAGGWGNVGVGITRRLAEAGLPVISTYVSNSARAEAAAEKLRAEGLKVWARQMDMGEAASIDAAIAFAEQTAGKLHTVACTSGVTVPFNNLADFTIEEVESFFSGDGMGYYRLVNRVVPALRRNGGGSITLCTTFALLRVIAFDGISPFSKGAVDAMVRQIAWEEAQHNIRCNSVPISWVVESDALTDEWLASIPSPTGERMKALIYQIRDMMRLKGPVPPTSIGDLFAFLASDQARKITGQSVSVDGGATL
jgi:NAD(P)-dependent dehydrogenase (short-subunit alcohol dehydrogenase family)